MTDAVMTGFEWLDGPPAETVTIHVDGVALAVPADRSLLAGLLAAGAGDFFCAIGQCQRCVVRINGVARPACLVRPAAGDEVATPHHWGRDERTAD